MAKKILAIFFVSILLCSYIIPTTSVFADVVIGDNDSYAVTELGVQNGKKIATMEAMLQLLESGVSEINFNDISDLDTYLEEFYDELTNVNYQDVSNEILAGAYNDVKELKQWIDDRGEYIATYYKDYLNSADEGLSDIFNNFQLKIPKTKLTGTSLNGFRSMSRFNSGDPTPQPDPNYNALLDTINGTGFYFKNWANGYFSSQVYYKYYPLYNYSFVSLNNGFGDGNTNFGTICQLSEIISIYIVKTGEDTYSAYVPYTEKGDAFAYTSSTRSKNGRIGPNLTWIAGNGSPNTSDNDTFKDFPSSSLYNILSSVASYFRNVNIYVDGVPWSIVGNPTSPTLDIDGFIKLYGNDNPIQYEFPQGTQIDYNALYTTIYNAIRDNLPLDMQTINNNQVYYDSHDTVYSPTIYNYYGKDGDDENDWIDSILDYATIPDFNSVLGTVAVLDAPFVNGITIVNAGVTDVIPSDILLIFGGFFVLVLFVCIINRMSE